MLKLKKKKGRTDEGCNNKLEINPHKFFKIILPHTLHHKILRIPEAFARGFSSHLPIFATLTIRSGLSWKIELERIDNKLYFTQGWADFMEHNAIKYGYFLEFEYQGNEHFKVHIFDLSCSEIEYPRESDKPTKYHRDHDDIVNERVIIEEEEEDDDEDEAEKDINSDCIMLGSNNINPSFTVVVRNYNISSSSCYLRIPKRFSNEHMKESLYEFVTLQTGDGREWCVNCHVYEDGFNLSGIIWKKFMKENQWDEHEGEEYTFVMVDKKRYNVTFKVIKELIDHVFEN